MNEGHLQFLTSPEWRRMLERDLLPWLERAADLGDDVLEVGPGPGLTTDILRSRAANVTAVEIDAELASTLSARLAGTNVAVLQADATATALPTDRFSAVTCFAMLHHVPSSEEQDQILRELRRVLRPGGFLVGTDSVDSAPIREFHSDDVFVPVDPHTFGARLEAAGFANVTIEVGEYEIRFVAQKPG